MQVFIKSISILFLLLLALTASAQEETRVTKTIKPLLADLPVVHQADVKGGYHVAVDLLTTGDISASKKVEGMLVWDVTTGLHYQWDGVLWEPVYLLKSWRNGQARAGQLYLKDGQIYEVLQDNVISGTSDPAIDPVNWQFVGVNVVDNLSSTSATDALSANQGRELSNHIELRPLGTTNGQMMYWKDGQWQQVAPAAQNGYHLVMDNNIPHWYGVPGAPLNVTAVAGDGEATVSFDAPASDGGTPITSYTAASYPDGISATINQSDGGSITIPGLSNGTSYFFTVTATNMAGTSPVSLASNAVTPDIEGVVPGAPVNVTAVAGDGEATVSFDAPASDGGSLITSYTIVSSPGGISTTLTQSGGGSVIITGLNNGTSYTFTVKATNAIGEGVASAVSNAVMPISATDVLSPTGKIWMDRNLGASRVATSSVDADAYGDLYQWGRAGDGHQLRTSGNIMATTASDTPGHSDFITTSGSPADWRIPQNDMLWQGVNGINNPCPSGYRLPTESEWQAEIETWSSDAAGAFASPLKLTLGGFRGPGGYISSFTGMGGWYWSSAVGGTNARYLHFSSSSAFMNGGSRASGFSVRCIKD